MISQRLTIWCNAVLSAAATEILRQGLRKHDLLISSADSDRALKAAEVVFGQPDPDALVESTKIRWLHLNSSGYTRYDTAPFRHAMRSGGVLVTNSSSIYSAPCAEHVLAMMLSISRRLPHVWRQQQHGQLWKTPALRVGCDILEGHTTIIFGLGAIGRRLVELLRPLRMKLIGVRRQPGGDDVIHVVTSSQADTMLHEADHVINILPEAADTAGFFGRDRLHRLKPTAIFYNIGRGSTVDQSALHDWLENNSLAAAYLDVTTPEPLPADHPLWRRSNCFITPHIGGVHAAQYARLVRCFLGNLQKFEQREPLDSVIAALSGH
jgi:phosphoglycerate dehydrogenase-like enzyme